MDSCISMTKKKILYLTDLNYVAKGRTYCDEDIYITGELREHFDVVLCHPKNAAAFERDVDLVVFRNTGGVSGFPDTYRAFVERAKASNLNVYNELTGKADMQGKQYLLDLTATGFPVIPTVDKNADIHLLPATDTYVIKPKDGADSIGLEFLSREELQARTIVDGSMLIQPKIDFQYELSFYFVDDHLEYAMYAPDKSKRWELQPYSCTAEDVAFAERFIRWNGIRHGIQRVDACRTQRGELLLVELEDLNPYLSLLMVDERTRHTFMNDFIAALNKMI